MTDPTPDPTEENEPAVPTTLDPDALADAVRGTRRAPASGPALADPPQVPRGGSDPTVDPVELDPQKLAAMIPRSLL